MELAQYRLLFRTKIFLVQHDGGTGQLGRAGDEMVVNKDYKGVYRLGSKIKDEGFEADLYKKH
jgi:hypothetical protein